MFRAEYAERVQGGATHDEREFIKTPPNDQTTRANNVIKYSDKGRAVVQEHAPANTQKEYAHTSIPKVTKWSAAP